MNFLELKRLTSRMLIAASFCVLLANCGNKSALFLTSDDVKNRDSGDNVDSNNKDLADKTEPVTPINTNDSDKTKKPNGEQQP